MDRGRVARGKGLKSNQDQKRSVGECRTRNADAAVGNAMPNVSDSNVGSRPLIGEMGMGVVFISHLLTGFEGFAHAPSFPG